MVGQLLNQEMKDATASDSWMMHKSTTLAVLKDYYEIGGHVKALYDALELCLRQSYSHEGKGNYCDGIPDWVLRGSKKIVLDRLHTGKSIGPGHMGNEKFISSESKKYLLRYLAVEKFIEEATSKGIKLSKLKASKMARNELTGKIDKLVSAKTIETSHRMVRREIHSPEHLWKYYPISKSPF